jgi:hypothetical protein
MKRIIYVLALAILLAGGAAAPVSAPAHAQVYHYAPPPADIYAYPWVGPNTPWIYYNGDWFLNGVLYYYFGPLFGWAPYYAFPPIFIVRPHEWYEPKWHTWYERNPQIIVHFHRTYPIWRGHTHSHRYDRSFYDKHHHGRDAGWQGGFRGVTPKAVPEKPAPPGVAPPEKRRPEPSRVAPREERRPEPRVAPREERKPEPRVVPREEKRPEPRVTPREERRPEPPRVAPREERRPAPSRVAPPEEKRPAPSRVAPPERPQPPSKAAPPTRPAPAPEPEKGGRGAPKPEKGGPGPSKSGGPGGEKQ